MCRNLLLIASQLQPTTNISMKCLYSFLLHNVKINNYIVVVR